MKKQILSSLLLLFASLPTLAQSALPDSPRRSTESHIYSITGDNLRRIYLQKEAVSEEMLGGLVTKRERGKAVPKLRRGNYIQVEAIENQLDFTDYVVDDLYCRIVPAEQMRICLHDSLGNIIPDAQVRSGSQKFKFNLQTQTYNGPRVTDEQLIEINNKGVYHYIQFEKEQTRYYTSKGNLWKRTWQKGKTLWTSAKESLSQRFNPEEREEKVKYTGFIVFSKPKYKPNETVKLKAYITKRNGKVYNKPVDLRLSANRYRHQIDTLLVKGLSPYRPGMYEHQFKLTDSLNLKLDTDYFIALQTKGRPTHEITAHFRHEEYQLKSVRFKMSSDRKNNTKSDSIQIRLKVTDENEMAMYGGRVEVVVTPLQINQEQKNAIVFIPDTLWRSSLDMSDQSEKQFTIPDSIFPQGASLYFKVSCTYLSADNETQRQYKTFYRSTSDYMIDFSLSKGLLTMQQLHQGVSERVGARIYVTGESGERLFTDTVTLPYTLSTPWFASEVTVQTKNRSKSYALDKIDSEPQLGYQLYRQQDSIYYNVENPAQIPFWYSLRKGKKEIASGHTTALNKAIKGHKKEGYQLLLSYLYGGMHYSFEQSLPYIEKNVSLDVTTPTTVYPGQTTNVLVTVTDKQKKPVKDMDITAYAFTSKFNKSAMPDIPIKGKVQFAKPVNLLQDSPEELGFVNRKSQMSWERWRYEMSLDTLAYYKFLYPNPCYRYTEKTSDGSTQLLPFVVLNGALQGVHMLWIDGKLYYTNLVEQVDIYTFSIQPGMHNLKFRTYDREIEVDQIWIEEGTKNIVSFDAGVSFAKINMYDKLPSCVLRSNVVKNEKIGTLTKEDVNYLSSQLIMIDNNFGSLKLPNVNETFDLPAYIHSGNRLYYFNQTTRSSWNHHLGQSTNTPLLVGPFPTRNVLNGNPNTASLFADNRLIGHLELEGGNCYTLYNQYQKVKSWYNLPFQRELTRYSPRANFSVEPLTPERINQRFDQLFKASLTTLTGSATQKERFNPTKRVAHLQLFINEHRPNSVNKPALIFIVPEKPDELSKYQLYYGGTRQFKNLPTGRMAIHLVLNDSLSYTQEVFLRPNGVNYLQIDSIPYKKGSEWAQAAFKLFNQNIQKRVTKNPYIEHPAEKDTVVVKSDRINYLSKNRERGVVTGTVLNSTGEPLIGASVVVVRTQHKTYTNLDGAFELSAKAKDTLEIALIGYQTKQIAYEVGADYQLILKSDHQLLEEVVVIGYQPVKSKSLTGSVASSYTSGSVKGSNVDKVRMRGGSLDDDGEPLLIVNGLVFTGKLEDLGANNIASMNTLKGASATALYGSRGANGVVIIQTNSLPSGETTTDEQQGEAAGNRMRRNFQDDAFWQPRLRTNEKGVASFKVTYPDDITSWDAYFIAIGNKKQSDKKQLSIRSFKSLTARLSLPQFAIRGDSMRAVGRIANHRLDTVALSRKIAIDGAVTDKQMQVGNSFVDQIPVKAETGDSLSIAYSIEMGNGYFDGEERSIPIFEQGVLQTYGDFKVINDAETHRFEFDPSRGPAILHVEAANTELLLSEIERVDNYPYLCNEQMASKIKVLLSKKMVATFLNQPFKEDQKIKNLIGRLNKNRNIEGLWGWWNQNNTEFWISKQVVSALLDAEEAGYKTNLDKERISKAFEEEVRYILSNPNIAAKRESRQLKQELLDRLVYLKRMNSHLPLNVYFKAINTQLTSKTISDKLKTMYTLSMLGMDQEVPIDSLLKDSRKTLLGSRYWGDAKEQNAFSRMAIFPHENNIENSLMAYTILKRNGGSAEQLAQIRNYFFENRQNGSWQNTYESSRIIETILPDMLQPGESFQEVSLHLNGKEIQKFPYTEQLPNSQPIEIKKTGTFPLFVSAYQKAWNNQPAVETKRGFSVKTYFVENQDSISYLTAGKTARLEVSVQVDADANYVQIEVPIPAGCSYENKETGYFRNEAHREYFKEKVVLFSNRLKKGEHKFSIELIPRFSGRYHLNPAKVELLYFPTFYGNEQSKIITIQ